MSIEQTVLIVTNIPTPYRIPLFNLLNTKIKNRSYNLHVVFAGRNYERRKWIIDESEFRFEHSYLKSRKLKLGSFEKKLFSYDGIYEVIKKVKPDQIIVAGFSPATLKLFFLSFVRKINYIIWTGSAPAEGYNSSSIRSFYRKILIKRAGGFIAYGSRAKKYLESMGAASEKIHIAINTVDVDFFSKIADDSIESKSRNTILFVGYLTGRKRVDLILNAMKIISDNGVMFRLEIVGDGTIKEDLQELARKLKLEEKVFFHGYKQKQDIKQYFSEASIFLFPTEYDIWGLVLNEAMAAGLCCLSSVHAGATDDLIIDGRTGFAVDFDKTQEVATEIEFLLNNPQVCKDIGENARKYVLEKASLEKSADGFIRALGIK